MEWIFTTPAEPHQNGYAEALVKSCKIALNKAIGNHTLTPFEVYTCLLVVANLVNQCPIGRIPNDPEDRTYLCLNDILLSRASMQVPQGPFRKTKKPKTQTRVHSEDCGLLLEMLDQRRISPIGTRNGTQADATFTQMSFLSQQIQMQ